MRSPALWSVAVAFSISQAEVQAWSLVSSSRISDGVGSQHISFRQPGRISLHARTSEHDEEFVSENNQPQNRRQAMEKILSAAVMSGLVVMNSNRELANAYEKTFPVELDTIDADPRTPRERALQESAAKPKISPLQNKPKDLIAGASLWGSALWFLTGSRSNPLATPLANLLYDSKEEEWLQDRNDGLFAALPAPLLLLLGLVFGLVGFGVHLATISLAEGSVAISLQLAGVLLIGGGALEIGRIASGEKKQTRDDYDRDAMLQQEFEEFATQRLKPGGNCHRSEVVAAFRRFHAKYRQADNPDYPLNDLEIEQLLRQWNDQNAGAQRSAAGFYTGIQINVDADIVIGR